MKFAHMFKLFFFEGNKFKLLALKILGEEMKTGSSPAPSPPLVCIAAHSSTNTDDEATWGEEPGASSLAYQPRG
jgi:hypothetical protein